MRRFAASVLLVFVLVFSFLAPVFAQAGPNIRPDNIQNNIQDNVIAQNSGNIADNADAKSISAQIFGPKRQTDMAFGAFQRGYYLTALSLALDRAGKNDTDTAAQTLIATIYANGLGVAENMALASSWYAIAAKNGDINATFQLAQLYQNGRGVPADRKRAAELFAQAAKMGNPEAKYNLALLHVEGIYATPSYSEAARLMKEAAAAGLAEAHYNYGIMLSEGAGVAPDAKAAANEIKIAAQMGLSEAQVEYATILYLGKGVPRNLARAVFWYRRAANASNPVAQNRLAKLFAAGEGVKLDLQTAAMWRSLARRQGLFDPGLDRLLVSITPEDQTRADQRARFWPGVVQSKTSAPPLAPATAGDAMGKAMLNMDKLLEPQKIAPVAPSSSPAK